MPEVLSAPPEIISEILQYLDISGLYSAIRAHSRFNNSWKLNTATISASVLNRSIDCYPQALRLDQVGVLTHPAGSEAILQRNNRIVAAAQCVSSTYDLYLQNLVACRGDRFSHSRRPLCHLNNDTNRQAFKQAIYWLWEMILTAEYVGGYDKDCRLPKPLEQHPRLVLLSLCEFLSWKPMYSGLYNIISRTRRVYNSFPRRPRLSHHMRWLMCCDVLWQDSDFKQQRQACWSSALDPSVVEPDRLDPLLDDFLDWVRVVLQSRPDYSSKSS